MGGLNGERMTKRKQKETDRQEEKVRHEYWAAGSVINADTDRLTDTYRLFHLTSSTPLDRPSGLVGLCLRLSHLDRLVFHMADFLIARLYAGACTPRASLCLKCLCAFTCEQVCWGIWEWVNICKCVYLSICLVSWDGNGLPDKGVV